MEVRATIAKRLGEMIHSICKGSAPANMFEVFMEDFVDAVEFVDYFKATWYPRLGYAYYSRLQFSLYQLFAFIIFSVLKILWLFICLVMKENLEKIFSFFF